MQTFCCIWTSWVFPHLKTMFFLPIMIPFVKDFHFFFSLTLVQNEGHVALGHLVALLSQQQVLDQRSICLTLPKAAVGRHETLRPATALTHVLEKLQRGHRCTVWHTKKHWACDDVMTTRYECNCWIPSGETLSMLPHLYSSVAGTHHTSTSGVHLGQVVEGQDVACLWGQVEEFKRLLVITLYTNAIWGTRLSAQKTKKRGKLWQEALRILHTTRTHNVQVDIPRQSLNTHCNTWCPAGAVHPPSPAPLPSGSISVPAHSSEDTNTQLSNGCFLSSTKNCKLLLQLDMILWL